MNAMPFIEPSFDRFTKTITIRIDIGNRDTEEDTSSLGYQDYKNPDQNELLRIFAPRRYCLLIF